MSIAGVSLTSGFSDTDATSYNTASVTPVANRLVLVSVMAGTVGASAAPALTGNGLTYVLVASQHLGDAGNRLSVFRALGGAPTSGAITIDFAGVTQVRCLWSVTHFSGVDDTGGTDGSAAVVQSVATANAGSVNITATLAAFANAANGAYAACASNTHNNYAATPESGWTELHDVGSSEATRGLYSQWRPTNDTTAHFDWTSPSANQLAAIALEMRAAGTGRLLPLLGVGT